MRKRTYLALALAGLLVFSPAMSQVTMAAESEETEALLGEEDIVIVSDNDAAVSDDNAGDMEQDADQDGAGDTGQNNPGDGTEGGEQEGSGTEEKIQLPVPTGLRWGENWMLEWDPYTGELPEGTGIDIDVYKDGEFFQPASWGLILTDGWWESSIDKSLYIEDSGTYKFRLRTYVRSEEGNQVNSEWSEWSEEKTYVRPQQQLGTVVGQWSEEEKGVFLVPVVEGANHIVQLYFTPLGGNNETLISAVWYYGFSETYRDEGAFPIDYNYEISEYGAGKYRATIWLISQDIDTIANGVVGEFSEYLEITDVPAGDDSGDTGSGDSGNQDQDNPGGSIGDGDQTGGGTEENIQLPVPTGLRWGENWMLEWDPYTGELPEETCIDIDVYKDGETFWPASFDLSLSDGRWIQSHEISPYIEDSGTYKFRLRTYIWSEDGNQVNSEWSEWSEEKTYVRPQQQLGTVVGQWSEEEKGVFLVPVVDGADHVVRLYFTPQGGDTEIVTSSHWCHGFSESYRDEGTFSLDFNFIISEYGAGKYRATIWLISQDIDTIANGVVGEFSEYYDTSQTAETVSGLLSDAISSSATKKDALEAIKENIDKRSLNIAMQTDDSVLNQIKDLESDYIAEQNITVAAPSVSAEASAYVDASEISVVGAGLNAAADSKVGLEVSVPDKLEYIPGQRYSKSVQLDIRLTRDGESVHQLDIPITINMPIPTEIDLSRLVILHYYEDGTFETVPLKNNGDGTITFTVDRFSTFVFAETVTNVSDDDDANVGAGGEDTGKGNTDTGSGSTETDASYVVSPNTGESAALQILVYAIIVLAVGVATILFWKKKHEETAK